MDSNLYDEFSECTTHYYDELGKLDECSEFFTKKQCKQLRNRIISLLFDNIDTLFKKENVSNKVEKNEIKKMFNKYNQENNKGFTQKTKSLLTIIKDKINTKKLGQTSQQVQIEVSKSVEQLPPSSQQDTTTQTESDVVVEGENSETQEPEKNSQEEQNGDA